MIRHWTIQHRDITELVRLVATHPILSPRYGDSIKDLPGAWRRLLNNEWFFNSALYEETSGASVRTLGAAISVFVTDAFFQEAKVPPLFWLGPELTRRIAQCRSPLLSEKQVSEANTNHYLVIEVHRNKHAKHVCAENSDSTVTRSGGVEGPAVSLLRVEFQPFRTAIQSHAEARTCSS